MMMQEKLSDTIQLEKLNLFINQRYGLEFRQQRLLLLEAAVEKRSKIRNMASISQYLELIEEQEEEALLLINLLTVHETYFFREPLQLTVMSEKVIPRLLKSGNKPFIRLLSAGCSTGEEAYSMAMAALEIPGAGISWDFEVIGIDVDKEALQKAQKGLYGLYSFRSCPQHIRDTYFSCVAKESFQIKNIVKEKVHFESLNLFAPSYPEWTKNMDVVFYRNVSIYFSKEQRREVFRRLSGLLSSSGSLFLSCTETLDHNNDLMTLVKSGEVFYYKKQVPFSPTVIDRIKPVMADKPSIEINKSRQDFLSKLNKDSPRLVPEGRNNKVTNNRPDVSSHNRQEQCQQMFTAGIELIKLKKYEEAMQLLNEIIKMDSSFIKAYTLQANILLNQQNIEPAIELCEAALVMDTFWLEAYLLLGMAAKLAGKMEMAIQRFKEAVYVYPECWLAHFFLGEVYQLWKEKNYAKREYEVAMRILQQGNFEKHGLSFFLVPFQLDDFIQLCQHNIEKMQA